MKGRVVSKGKVCAEALTSQQMFGFFAAVDTKTGIVIDEHSDIFGQCIRDKVLVFPEGRGSTVGAAVVLELVRTGNAPAAIINRKAEGIIATGAILADKIYGKPLPLIDMLDEDPVSAIRTGDMVSVDGETGEVTVIKE